MTAPSQPLRHFRFAGLTAALILVCAGVPGADQVGDPSQSNAYEGKNCLTSGCHANLVEPKSVHAPVAKSQCSQCHEPTDKANHKFRVIDTDTCIKCHEKWYEQMTSLAHVHAPAGSKDCLACHVPHASRHGHLLTKAFSDDLYVSSKHPEKYDLCFECHDRELYEEELTDEDTEFRNGELNLHYLHVNKELKGRSCRICHRAHASDQPRLIRSAVPFGQWELKIQFIPTETGGACGPGCHPAKQYDRQTPVDWNKEPLLKEWPRPQE